MDWPEPSRNRRRSSQPKQAWQGEAGPRAGAVILSFLSFPGIPLPLPEGCTALAQNTSQFRKEEMNMSIRIYGDRTLASILTDF